MAFRAFTLLLAFFKLPFVRIGFVAIAAIGEGERLFEVAIQVARDASNLGMLSDQRIFRFRVIEIEAGKQVLPAAGGVATLAGLLELALVWIDVARRAGVEVHVLVASGSARRIGFVALFAGDFYVQARQRIFRFGVIKILGSLPAFHVVALGTFVAKLAFVRIGVAGSAVRGLAEERLRQVLHLDEFAICRKHMRRRVTFFTRKWSVFAL